MTEFTMKVLIGAGVLTLIIGLFDTPTQWIEGVSIFFAVLFITSFAALFETLKQKHILKLHEVI